MAKTRILIADDHAIVRKGLRLLLEDHSDMEVVGEAGDGLECLRMVAELKPDLVLMDIAMPGMDGITATKRAKGLLPGVHILGLTMHEDERYFFRMIQAGASGYVVKGAAPDELLSAIRSVAQGKAYLHPSVTQKLLNDYLRRVGKERNETVKALSEREEEVLRLVAEGLTTAQIAQKLYIAIHTVERHRSNIMDKLDLHNRAELIKYAIRTGLVNA